MEYFTTLATFKVTDDVPCFLKRFIALIGNVTRFDEISPLWQKIKTLCHFIIVRIRFGNWTNYYCYKWPNFEKLIQPCGHTGRRTHFLQHFLFSFNPDRISETAATFENSNCQKQEELKIEKNYLVKTFL